MLRFLYKIKSQNILFNYVNPVLDKGKKKHSVFWSFFYPTLTICDFLVEYFVIRNVSENFFLSTELPNNFPCTISKEVVKKTCPLSDKSNGNVGESKNVAEIFYLFSFYTPVFDDAKIRECFFE